MSLEESEDDGMFVDCEVVHDSIGVTHFLPPKRCKNCDGFGIGAGFQVSYALGLLVALAVVLHDFSDGLNTVTLMLKNNNTTVAARSFLLGDAAAPIIGVMASFVILTSSVVLSFILAFFAGEFLSIASTDLLPEAHAKEESWRMICLTLIGLAVIFILTRVA